MVADRTRATALLAVAVAGAGCGGEDERPRPAAEKHGACVQVRAADVERVLGRRPLTARQEDNLNTTTCRYRGKGVSVRLIVDSASQAGMRYYNSLTERQQFYADDPELRPRNVKGVGEDKALGGPAAYWVSSTARLAAYGYKRIVQVELGARGLSDARSRRVAARIGRIAFERRGR